MTMQNFPEGYPHAWGTQAEPDGPPMTAERTPDARVEAAARALYPYMWAESYWPPMTFGQTGTLAERVEEEREIARTKVADALAAADAVQREGLTERVAEAERLVVVIDLLANDIEDMRVNGYQIGTQLVRRVRAITRQAAAVVAAIYGTRP